MSEETPYVLLTTISGKGQWVANEWDLRKYLKENPDLNLAVLVWPDNSSPVVAENQLPKAIVGDSAGALFDKLLAITEVARQTNTVVAFVLSYLNQTEREKFYGNPRYRTLRTDIASIGASTLRIEDTVAERMAEIP